MSLSLIVGPPNSGRAGEVRRRLEASLDRDPVLVVPTADDAARFEADLCRAAGSGAILGASTLTFRRLFEELAAGAGLDASLTLSAPQRLALVRAAASATPLRILARSSRRAGFGAALDALIGELQAALVEPDELESASSNLEDPALELELAAIYRTYLDLRARTSRHDAGSIAREVLRHTADGLPDGWEGRPVLLYGFDDLTRAQLELVARLAATSDVAIAVNYEDRRALDARAGLLADLVEELGATREPDLPHDTSYTRSAVLRHLDRHLFEPRAPLIDSDDGLVLMECAGELGEAEAIGGEIARLLAAGTNPGDIAVVLRHPASHGPLLGRVLERLGIPVAVEADVPLARTAVGRALVALCHAAAPEGTAEEMLAYLRSDPSMHPSSADWLERRIRRGLVHTAAEAIESWSSPPLHWARLREATSPGERLAVLRRAAIELAERPHTERAPVVNGARAHFGEVPFDPVELRAGRTAAELLGEVAEVGTLPGCEQPDLAEAAEAIEAASVPLWRGTTERRVRVLSPYRIRAGRARYLFCASLQESEFPGPTAASPLLGEERRRGLGIKALRREDQADEERYLFHACVSRPTERLYLSWRSSGEDGSPLARSPFIDEVLDLLAPDPEAAEEELKRVRGLDRTTFEPAEAPTARELARSLAARSEDAETTLAALAGPAREEVLRALAAVPAANERPGPLRSPEALEEIAARPHLSANSLEGWIECSYRWFVDHELQPERLEPRADPLWLGGVVHAALERLYRDPPGGEAIPRPADLPRWRERLGDLLAEEAAEKGAPPTGERALALARARVQAERFLEDEAASETTLRPRPELLELAFGFEGEGDPGPLELGPTSLRGIVDRIDLAPDGQGAVIRDYKTSREVPGAAAFEGKGKLQLQLYMRLVRDRLGLDVIGGLFQPLGARKPRDRRPRGMVRKDDPRAEGLDLVATDLLDPDEFEAELDRAVAAAIDRAAAMRAGEIDRDPIGGTCPKYCTYQAICRLERSLGPAGEDGNGDE